jgi:hypothetical protein
LGSCVALANVKHRDSEVFPRPDALPYERPAEGDDDDTSRLGGWKSIEMVMRYTHVNVDELKGTIDRLPGGNLGDEAINEAKSA